MLVKKQMVVIIATILAFATAPVLAVETQEDHSQHQHGANLTDDVNVTDHGQHMQAQHMKMMGQMGVNHQHMAKMHGQMQHKMGQGGGCMNHSGQHQQKHN